MAQPPNVVLIHAHDLGRHLGCYGAGVETPNADRLADEGTRFSNHFTTAPQCSPSRGSLYTGCYPHVHGLLGLAHTDWEIDSRRTLPSRLADRGYETHQFGLQHVTDDPGAFGYDEVHTAGSLTPEVTPEVHSVNRARDVSDTVATYLTEGMDGPFFASVGFFEAHRIATDDPDDEEGDVLYGYGEDYDAADPDAVDVPGYLPDEPGVRDDLAAMHGMVSALDDGIGTVLDAIDVAGLASETLVLFTTEHGIAFPRAKGTCYDPGVEAALLARYPPMIDEGTVVDDLVSNVDVLPTVLDVATDEVPDNVDGHSLVARFADERTYLPRDRLFAEITWHDTYVPVRAVRTEQFKYLRHFWHHPRVFLPNDVFASRAGQEVRGRYSRPSRIYEELYDLEADPHERENLADGESHEQVRSRLQSALATWMRETDDPLFEGPVRPADYDSMFDGLE